MIFNNRHSEVKYGLVLEGGGMRGLYTAGVLDELMKSRVQFDGVTGVSAGIIHGASYVSEQYGRNIRYFLKYRGDKRFMSLNNFWKTGNICDADFCYYEIQQKLYRFDFENFRERAKTIEVYAVASNLETGEPEYIHLTDLESEQMEAVRASSSIPVVSNIVEYKDMKLLDGANTDSIPIAFMRDMGFSKNVVVLTRPEGYRKKHERMMPLIRNMYHEYPKYIDVCDRHYIEYNEELDLIAELEKQHEVVVIRPSKLFSVSKTEKDTEKLKRIYKLGRFDALNKLAEIAKL